ncbi:hypothetical protein GCM10017783_01800 [Deinococcus piscis]|uniref:Uncharacterized protein n=1 Tax=Deinococcus piscis TaxID=394230 RepID=A0ABQ3JWS7_9DEIO|nr:hypothetical protein [Deinococcus piscis]GHF93431.1 hypothetical protein GCM10017783_01800 [Deinococcus piscis]
MNEDFKASTSQDMETQSMETSQHDTGNGMSSQSHWTGDETVSQGVSPAGQPATDAGTALGGDPTRNEDQADQGVPESVIEGDGRNETGTTFSADPAGDKRL